MSGQMIVTLAQLNPKLRDTAGNLRTICRVLAEHAEADLAVFPELFLSGYTTLGVNELALHQQGPEMESVARAARESSTAVIFGALERVDGECANSAMFVDRHGDLVGMYRKTHLFGDERDAFLAGDDLLIADIDGTKVGLMICFDVEFPEVARALARAGADLLVTISANMEPFGRDHEVFCTARALENGIPHLYVNQVGPGERFTFAGGTFVVSAEGDCLAEVGPSEEKVINLKLDFSARSGVKPEHLKPDYLTQARPPLPVIMNRRANYEQR